MMWRLLAEAFGVGLVLFVFWILMLPFGYDMWALVPNRERAFAGRVARKLIACCFIALVLNALHAGCGNKHMVFGAI